MSGLLAHALVGALGGAGDGLQKDWKARVEEARQQARLTHDEAQQQARLTHDEGMVDKRIAADAEQQRLNREQTLAIETNRTESAESLAKLRGKLAKELEGLRLNNEIKKDGFSVPIGWKDGKNILMEPDKTGAYPYPLVGHAQARINDKGERVFIDFKLAGRTKKGGGAGGSGDSDIDLEWFFKEDYKGANAFAKEAVKKRLQVIEEIADPVERANQMAYFESRMSQIFVENRNKDFMARVNKNPYGFLTGNISGLPGSGGNPEGSGGKTGQPTSRFTILDEKLGTPTKATAQDINPYAAQSTGGHFGGWDGRGDHHPIPLDQKVPIDKGMYDELAKDNKALHLTPRNLDRLQYDYNKPGSFPYNKPTHPTREYAPELSGDELIALYPAASADEKEKILDILQKKFGIDPIEASARINARRDTSAGLLTR